MNERIRIDHGSLEAALKQLQSWKMPQVVRSEVLRFLEDLEIGKVNRGRKLPRSRQLKYLHALRPPLEFFNKATARLTLRDIEQFERALSTGKISNRITGKPYAHSTQVDIRMLLGIFLRWRLGESKATALAGWLDTRSRPKTPDFLTEAEIEKLYLNCRNAQQRFLVAVLFDSGARAEEFHNIRLEDIYLPEGRDSYVRLALKEEYSKTKGRTIALLWKRSQEAVSEYLSERAEAGIKPADPVFDCSYDTTKKQLQRLGHRVLQRPLRYHLFRHSSATYYATRLNRQELCYRYGWRFSSNMPDIYISRSGMESKAVEQKFTQTELQAVRAELAQVKESSAIKDERMRQMDAMLYKLQQDFANLIKAMGASPSLVEAKLSLKRSSLKSGS